ncbi:MAG: asparagine synthase (glutamine-hydrolyzing) [Opitutaceae bacterium]|nr:asparagine synthase (glutamine-hydrolyzing) [Opitutaceae bacterium]
MCGIAGFLGRADGDRDRDLGALRAMMASLSHRGPDADGAWRETEGRVHLGHRRLAIIDLSPGGAQPMATPDGRGVIVYNGEIFNFVELRAALEAEGFGFRSRSDTEVLLTALHHWGPAGTLPRLNGQFAFAYWDARDRSLTLARDRLGEKPLYYALQDGVLYFASELKALRAHPGYRAVVDRAVVPLFLRHGYVPAPRAIYEDTWKLPAAHWIRFGSAVPRHDSPVPYWSLARTIDDAANDRATGDANELADETERLLRHAVEQRLVSDRPIGCFLSGGIDSSTIAALMQRASSRKIRTFTVGYREAALNEADEAAKVARHLGTEHTTFTVGSAEALGIIPRLAEIYDEPFADSSQIPASLLAQLTARHVTVALTGDGGDEIFGGYNRHVAAARLWPRLSRWPLPLRRALAAVLTGAAGSERVAALLLAGRARSPVDKIRKLAQLARSRDERELYRRLTAVIAEPERFSGLAGGPLPFEEQALPAAPLSPAERMMFWDTLTYLPDDILAKVDRAAMAFGLEGRIPFLDNDVVRFAWRLPLAEKVGPNCGKLILRRVLGRHVPRELFDRPKAGFAAPIGEWLRGPLRGWAEALLRNPTLAAHVRIEPVWALWRAHLRGRENGEHALWTVLMFGAWLDRWHPAPPPSRLEPKGRVVFLLQSLDGAGAEKQVVLTALALARHGHGVEIFTLAPGANGARLESLLAEAQAAGVMVFRPPDGRGWLTSSVRACRASLRRDHRCVLWTWGHRADVIAHVALNGLAPRIGSLRSAGADFVRRRAFWSRLTDSSCVRYVSNTHLNIEQLAGIMPGVRAKCRVLYNALEPAALAAAPVALPERIERLEIVMLGNVRVGVKGYDFAVEMMRRLRAEGRAVRLRIAGLPIEAKELAAVIAAAGVGDAVEFAGPVADPFPFLRSAHVFLLFSRLEGMPNALLEAMALGLPCISARVGDVAAFTQDRVHLRQIDVGDVAAACGAVRDAIENWPEFRAMGAAARRLIAERFSAAEFEKNLLACIGDVMPNGRLPT